MTSVVRIAKETFMACKAESEKRIGKRTFNEPSRGKGNSWNKKTKDI